jgi:putative CocE/NonD family hydrolase
MDSSDNLIYDLAVDQNVMVPMRDGVRLATDIYRPARGGQPVEGRLPVILERTPYGKQLVSRTEIDRGESKARRRPDVAAWFVRHGYIVAYQDCRGRFDSEGEFVKYLAEGEDGCDTIAWLAAQPWCDGRVATMGLSYAAHTQVAAACLAPPAMAAMVVDSGGFANAYSSGIRQGGAFELKQATWAFKYAKDSPLAAADPVVRAALEREDLFEWFKAMPWKPGHSPLRRVPEYEDYLFEQWTHGAFDAYWRKLGIWAQGYYAQLADVPQVHLSSWYDAYIETATENYVALRKLKRGPVRLIMGPWTHGDRAFTYSGDVDFGPAATIDGNLASSWSEFRLRWFDHWLKGARNGVEAEPAVRLFLMGGGSGRRNAEGRMVHGGRWIAAEDWPVPAARKTPYYLHPGGRLAVEKPAGGGAAPSYDFAPSNPVPTIGGTITSGEPIMVGGAFDQREDARFFGVRQVGLPLAARHDVLVFQTEPLPGDVAVIGPVTARLHVSSSCPDTDFTIKLVDVHPPNEDYPDGFAMNLTDGILRCRYRDSWEKPALMEPDQVYAITIRAFATCNLFRRGHRIRVDVSSSNFPKYDVNPNTGEPEGRANLKRVATNTVHVGGNRASHVELSIVPVDSLRFLGDE